MDVIVESLRRLDLFDALTPIQLTEIVRNADRVMFNSGDTILEFGEECDAATVIVSGDAVCLRDANDQPTEDPVLPGSILAEMAMVVDIEASATVVACSKIRAVRITRASMLELFREEPEVADALLDKIMVRLRHVADHLKMIEGQIGSDTDLEIDTVEATTGNLGRIDQTLPLH